MGKRIGWLVAILQLAFVAAACAFCLWKGYPIWAGLILGVLAVVLNALLLRWEDNQPGGFNDP